MSRGSGSGVIYTKERSGMKMESPFALKVGQVFTGFGIGCGVGIGMGRPLNLGSIPVLNQVMVATRGATDAFSGVHRHVNSSLRKVGAKNIEAGIGCGIGFGHGFGVVKLVTDFDLYDMAGIAVKPGVQAVTHLVEKLGISSTLPLNESILPVSLQTGIKPVKDSIFNGSYVENTSDGNVRNPLEETINTRYGSRTETAINNFLENPLLKEDSGLHEQAERLRSENNVLQMVLKHQVLIDELMRENEKLRKVLIEELKVEPGKLQWSFMEGSKAPCSDCFECRRKQRRR